MSTTKIYTNFFGVPVAESQIASLEEYQIHSFVNNKLRIIEVFNKTMPGYNFRIVYGTQGETLNALKNEFVNDAEVDVVINVYNTTQNNNTLWDSYEYNKVKQLVGKGQVVHNNQNKKLYESEHNLTDNSIITAEKFFYGGKYNDQYSDLIFSFLYMSDGSLDHIYDEKDEFGKYYQSWESTKIETEFINNPRIQAVFNWSQQTYFHSATPIMP
jgi:hypothetical protein